MVLSYLSQTPVIASNVENVAEALNNATQSLLTQQQGEEDEVELTPEDVQNIAETFRNIVDVESVTPEVRYDRGQKN